MAKFTWFDRLTRVINGMPEDYRGELALALINYGTYGTEPDLEWPLDSLFDSLKDDIDNSKAARKFGQRGGRSRSASDCEQSETPLDDTAKGGSDTTEPPLQSCETTLDDDAKGGSDTAEPIPIHTNPIHTKPNQKSVRRFRAPTQEEVRDYAAEYAAAKSYDPGGFDAERFIDYYTSNGWKVGRNPMKDWKAAVRDWVRRDCEPKGGVDFGIYDKPALKM